jgi:hypothetical protein
MGYERLMKRLIWLALVAASATACGKKAESPSKDKPAPAPTADEAPPAQTKLTVTHAGVTTPMTSAVAVRWQDDSIHVLVANNPISCEEALGSARIGVPRGDVSFDAGVSRRLAPDGTFRWELTHYSFDVSPEEGELAPAQVSGDPVVGKNVEVSFTYKDVKGTIVAHVCGDRPIEKDHPAIAKAKHPSTATITIAGQKVPIVAAWRFEDTTYLSSEPITCAYAGLPTRVALVHDMYGWHIEGDWFAQQLRPAADAVSVTAGATGDSADGPTVALTLAGNVKFGDYPVELAGTIEALACKQRN